MNGASPLLRGYALAAAAFALAGCECKHQNNVGGGLAELAIVWSDEWGTVHMDRDATITFGAAASGERLIKPLTVRNQGATRLSVLAVERLDGDNVTVGELAMADAPFDVRFSEGVSLEALEEHNYDMFFSPTTPKTATEKETAYQVRLTVTGEGTPEGENTATVTLKAKGINDTCLLPDVLDFGLVPVGERFQLSYTVNNATSVPMDGTLTEPFSTTGDHLAFGLAPGTTTTFTTAPGGSTVLTFEFAPKELRPYSAAVKMRASAHCPEAEVKVLGEGSGDVFSWAPSSIDFGYVSPNAAAPQRVVFTNLSKTPVTLTNVATGMADFFVDAQGQDPKTFVAGAGTSTLTVACKPSSLGPRSTSLTFDTGLSKTPKGSIELKCYGGGPKIQVTPKPTLSFGKVGFFPNSNPPPQVTRKLNVMNVGTKPPNADPKANLLLGTVTGAGPGQLPYIALKPLNQDTAPSEFMVGLPGTYNPAVGLDTNAGKNMVDLVVTLSPQSLGTKEAELTVYSNDPSASAVVIKLTADVQSLPPCNLQVSPGTLNFGLVQPPNKADLPVTVTNLGQNPTDLCYLSNIDLAPGSDPAFVLPAGAVPTLELQPKQSATIVVRAAPMGLVPATTVTLTGQLNFNVSSPTKPLVQVPLSVAVGPVCLTIAPDPLDFGTVKKDCSSSTRNFNIYNTCPSPVTITSFAMQAAAGQPAGGPSCPGTQPCPEFYLVSTPAIPAGGLVVQPGAAPVTFSAKFHPIDMGPESGAIAVNAVQSAQNVAYLVSLKGAGDAAGLQTDVFQQDPQPKADILLVVDNSGSMSDKQQALANNLSSFMSYAVTMGVDWQVGVTTTDDEPAEIFMGTVLKPEGEHGRLLGSASNPKVLTPTTPNVQQLFAQKVNVGTNGAGIEKGLDPAVKAVTAPLVTSDNAGFLRQDANLAIVVVTDAPDQSVQPVSYYMNLFLNVKGFNRANMFTFSAIAPFLTAAPSGCTYDSNPDDGRYGSTITQTNGVQAEICDPNWNTKLQDLGKTAFGFRTVFFLNSTPDLTGGKTIDVKVNGATVASGPNTWQYDSTSNSIVFVKTAAPGPGQTLSVTYTVACL